MRTAAAAISAMIPLVSGVFRGPVAVAGGQPPAPSIKGLFSPV
ncbi:hypothetical protein DCCM_3504 [Desulfocucumis palustris]|uniref:Uncharacterized protein n=1 Tax=Desulfocucumis palustris TaxID=1898651 RepID=A0A2L2XKF4_9FIRM|nr:hypothetical protein DCCM_3504 [Desulfocucumis palustris]